MNLLLDENLPLYFRAEFVRRVPGIQVRRVGDADAPPLGTDDPTILTWCEAEDFLLLTNNRHSMPTHLSDHLASGRHVPGLIIIRGGSPGQILDEVELALQVLSPADFRDLVLDVP